jgi:hypothetical protein
MPAKLRQKGNTKGTENNSLEYSFSVKMIAKKGIHFCTLIKKLIKVIIL